MSVGDNIRSFRKAAGMSRDDLAALLNVEEKDVALWERGISVPEDALICRIAGYLGVPASDIAERPLQYQYENCENEDENPLADSAETETEHDISLKIVTPVEDMLEDGERLIWVGKPTTKNHSGISGNVQMISAVVWIIIVLGGIINVITAFPPSAVIGVPLLLYGIYKAAKGLYRIKKQKEFTNYAITNRRVIIKCDYKVPDEKSIDLFDIKSLRCEEGRNGTGNIIFFDEEEPSYKATLLPASVKVFSGKGSSILQNGFYDISDVVKVCDIFRNILG